MGHPEDLPNNRDRERPMKSKIVFLAALFLTTPAASPAVADCGCWCRVFGVNSGCVHIEPGVCRSQSGVDSCHDSRTWACSYQCPFQGTMREGFSGDPSLLRPEPPDMPH
jgi:hypothetical protein